MKFEYRICWAASSNISFRDCTDWAEWDGEEESAEAIEEAITSGSVNMRGLEEALEGSRFEWWVEVRRV